jgi:hypothetical protein
MGDNPMDKSSEEKRFNETLKRMLKTPPTPHDDQKKKDDGRSRRPPVSHQDRQDGGNANKA